MTVHGICHKQIEMGYDEYKKFHIPNAIFFDLDKNSQKETDLPHMLVGDKRMGRNCI